jgi:hypothetical protein
LSLLRSPIWKGKRERTFAGIVPGSRFRLAQVYYLCSGVPNTWAWDRNENILWYLRQTLDEKVKMRILI